MTKEDRGIATQLGLVVLAFRQNSLNKALALTWPIAARRISEIARALFSPLKIFTSRYWAIRRFIQKHLPDAGGVTPQILGNYAAFPERLSPTSVIYSFGVGADVRFDFALRQATGCTVHLFDPTPRSARLAESFEEGSGLYFYPWGIWREDKNVWFYTQPTLFKDASGVVVQDHRSGSIKANGSYGFEAACFTLQTIMNRLGHDAIDLLKMDIEGAALDVMENILVSNVRPGQIIAEFELIEGDEKAPDILIRLEALFVRLRNIGYLLYPIKRSPLHVDSIEVLAVRA
jgi:FkbM family methyltransferase